MKTGEHSTPGIATGSPKGRRTGRDGAASADPVQYIYHSSCVVTDKPFNGFTNSKMSLKVHYEGFGKKKKIIDLD